ncbi:MAG: hypothetical protein M3Q16_02010 [Pseudomonadota bacterium]|nr:hypothetical protein [Pseudomonadota bacterium]
MKKLKLGTLILIMAALSGCISIGSKGSPGPQGAKGETGSTTVIVPEKTN